MMGMHERWFVQNSGGGDWDFFLSGKSVAPNPSTAVHEHSSAVRKRDESRVSLPHIQKIDMQQPGCPRSAERVKGDLGDEHRH